MVGVRMNFENCHVVKYHEVESLVPNSKNSLCSMCVIKGVVLVF